MSAGTSEKVMVQAVDVAVAVLVDVGRAVLVADGVTVFVGGTTVFVRVAVFVEVEVDVGSAIVFVDVAAGVAQLAAVKISCRPEGAPPAVLQMYCAKVVPSFCTPMVAEVVSLVSVP